MSGIRQLYSGAYPAYLSLRQLIGELSPNNYSCHFTCQRRYFDTFDWRLHSAGYLFEEDIGNKNPVIRLRSREDGILSCNLETEITPRFYWDLPSGELKNRLKTLLSERALLALGTLHVKHTYYEIMDDADKIIMRITVNGLYKDKKYSGNKEVLAFVELHPLRGYDKALYDLVELLSTRYNFITCSDKSNIKIFNALGKTPGDYSSKLRLELEPDMPGQSALSKALLYNLDIMEKNEKGIIEDIDMEFLHDFRIAGRRSRSVISNTQGVFQGSRIKHFRDLFAWLSKLSSAHRDLDVFLWDFNYYARQASLNGGMELEPLRTFLQQNRSREHKRLTRALNTKRFSEFKTSWRNFLEGQQKRYPDKGSTPIINIANYNIWRCYKKMLNHENIIKTNYTFNTIHTLRKNGKKLRYLIDTFSSLYPGKEISKVIICLKKLQNNLGDITDMHVQRDMLHDWKTELANNKKIPQETFSAINNIERFCKSNEKTAQKKVIHRYHQFSSKQNQKIFKDIFKPSNK